MSRLIPQTLRGWLILIVLSSSILTLLVLFLTFVDERRAIASGVYENETFGRIRAIAARLEEMPPDQRTTVPNLAGSSNFLIRIEDHPAVAADRIDRFFTARLNETLRADGIWEARVLGAPPPGLTEQFTTAAPPVADDAIAWTPAVPLSSAPRRTAIVGDSILPVTGTAPADVTRSFFPPGGNRVFLATRPEGIPLLVSVGLSDGQWLNVLASPVSPPGPMSRLMIAALVIVVLLTGLAVWGAGRVAKPLAALSQAATRIGREDSVALPPVKGPADVRSAISAFNAMASRIKALLGHQRVLLQSVGHDLRTPLTSLRIRLEFVEDRELRERLIGSVEEIERLTNETLEAASGGSGEPMRPVDLGSLVESIVDDEAALGRPVRYEPSAPVRVEARSGELRRAVRNLIDNAVRHGGGAELRIEASADTAAIVFADRGPGIADDDLDRVVEPFVQLERARSGDGRGHGLGLTIVTAIAERHGGRLVLGNRLGGGLEARLELPVAPLELLPKPRQAIVAA